MCPPALGPSTMNPNGRVAGSAGQAGGEVHRRDDGQEPGQGQVAARASPRSSVGLQRTVTGASSERRPWARTPKSRSSPLASDADHARDLRRVPGADQHVVDAREHGPEQAEGQRDLDLAQEVDPDRAAVLLLGQPDLAERADDRQLLQGHRRGDREPWDGLERRVRSLAAVDVVLLHHPQGHRRDREGGQRPAHVATGIAGLQAPGAHHVQRGAGDHSQLAGLADGPGQLPPGDGHPHPALDDRGKDVLVVHGTTCG